MRLIAAICLAVAAALAHAEKILLVPLDSRPAAGQFAQMIGNMASVEVITPPEDLLGRFTQPGSAEGVLDWLESQDYADVTSVIVSSDMVAYGGLIASRTNDVSEELALQRLRRLAALRRKAPNIKIYVFSAIMRLAPTATKASAGWRLQLARYEELKDRYRRFPKIETKQSIDNLLAKIPPQELQKYTEARTRNNSVQRELIKMVARSQFDYLILGQDDAQPYGPHIPETQSLRKLSTALYTTAKVYFCEGIDQHANVLLSRALLKQAGWIPKVRIVYSDEAGKFKFSNYESKTVQESLRDQIFASGARPMGDDGAYDYSLYLNTPDRRAAPFQQFLDSLTSEVDQGFPVSVADINLGKDGTADPQLFQVLSENDRMMKLLSYAGWNTAGNSMGTAIPAANVYLLSRRKGIDPLEREIAQREFLLHRFVNDFAYHKLTRPKAYQMIDADPTASRDETYGEAFERVNSFVRDDLEKHLDAYFTQDFKGKRFFAGTRQYQVTSISDVRIYLPWPRAYEVRLEFRLHAEPVP